MIAILTDLASVSHTMLQPKSWHRTKVLFKDDHVVVPEMVCFRALLLPSTRHRCRFSAGLSMLLPIALPFKVYTEPIDMRFTVKGSPLGNTRAHTVTMDSPRTHRSPTVFTKYACLTFFVPCGQAVRLFQNTNALPGAVLWSIDTDSPIILLVTYKMTRGVALPRSLFGQAWILQPEVRTLFLEPERDEATHDIFSRQGRTVHDWRCSTTSSGIGLYPDLRIRSRIWRHFDVRYDDGFSRSISKYHVRHPQCPQCNLFHGWMQQKA